MPRDIPRRGLRRGLSAASLIGHSSVAALSAVLSRANRREQLISSKFESRLIETSLMHNQNESGEWRPGSAEDMNAVGSNEIMPSSQFETHWRARSRSIALLICELCSGRYRVNRHIAIAQLATEARRLSWTLGRCQRAGRNEIFGGRRLPSWVKLGPRGASELSPFWPQERT
jgi:hypothetical protein